MGKGSKKKKNAKDKSDTVSKVRTLAFVNYNCSLLQCLIIKY